MAKDGMKDDLKSFAHGVLTSKRGDGLFPVRWAKGALLKVNGLLGEPLLPKEQLEERRQRHAEVRATAAEIGKGKLGAMGASATGFTKAAAPTAKAPAEKVPDKREPAPVAVYMDWNSRHDLKRLTEVLLSSNIPYKQLDVTEDEATRSFVKGAMQQLGIEDLPVLFIAGEIVGGFHEVTQLDVSGELKRKVFGA